MGYCRNIGTWGRVWRVAVGLALAVSCCAAMALGEEPPAAVFLLAIAGALGGSFMVFEGAMRWCVLKSLSLVEDEPAETDRPGANVQ